MTAGGSLAEPGGWRGRRRRGPRTARAALIALVATGTRRGTAWGHHPGGGAEDGPGFGTWLFVAGVVLLLGMVGWAVFAPEGKDPKHEDPLD